jgi:hypothetical protein
MIEQKAELLDGQEAKILTLDKKEIPVTFAYAKLTWESGGTLPPSKEKPAKHPEIRGDVKADKNVDFSQIKDAELILNDKRVFKISFLSPTNFFAHESINSRTVVAE